MLINELAEATGASARALRHYEERGLLEPGRTGKGYRVYSEADVTRVAQIRAMISAGLGTSTIRRYFECVRSGDRGIALEMCPDLRAELDSLAGRLEAREAQIRESRRRLTALSTGDRIFG